MVTSASMFVSCKDYDDDINANKSSITALQEQVKTLEAALNAAKSDIEAAKNTFATKTELGQVEAAAKAAAEQAAATAKAEAIQSVIDQINSAITAGGMAGVTDTKSFAVKVAGIDEALLTLKDKIEGEDGIEAAIANIELQLQALDILKGLTAADAANIAKISSVITDVEGLKTDVSKCVTTEALQQTMNQASTLIDQKIGSEINTLTYLVMRALNSIALLPDLYVNGIEAIEFKSLYYIPVKPGTSGNTTLSEPAILVDNGAAEATYRLNPSTVKLESLDIDGIEYKAAKAVTRNSYVASPVAFNGIKSYENGLMTVTLKKTVTESLNLPNGQVYIVSLKVPRKADAAKNIEAADIYSENSRLIETTFTPQIAALPWSVSTAWAGAEHYSDSLDIYGSRIDANVLVTKEITYNEPFDLKTLVTGCYDRDYTDRTASTHNQITKDELKGYGVAFRFAIAKAAYNNGADNNTDQQQFAVVDPVTGIITSKTPAGVTDNMAVVGKEPIVRVDLVDTVHNNKLIDQRYLKVKWTNVTKPAIQLADKKSEGTLKCEASNAEFTWQEFVNEIYAKAQDSGLSQANFESIYPFDNIVVTPMGWETNYNTTGTYSGCVPVFGNTTNANGDALVATWSLHPQDILTVYNSAQTDTKTFKAKVLFKSSLPNQYGDIWFNWSFTIKLPVLPSINGYYDQYWFSKYDTYDVLPVQYNTPAQTLSYCVYDNNLMNGFTYWNDNGVRKFIVKDLPECGTWDMQFSQPQSVMTAYAPNYIGVEPDKTQDTYTKFGAYQLMKGNDKALQLNWNAGHTSWCGNAAHKEAKLFADHNNVANWDLINPLSNNDVTTELGLTVPERTHNKKVEVSIWATLNEWNYIPVKKYNVCLIAPLRVNAALDGKFEDGHVSGTTIDCSNAFTMTDFRGYKVANTPDDSNLPEQEKYTKSLYDYYEVQAPVWDFANVRYTMKEVNGNISVDNTLSYNDAITSIQLRAATNGNIDLSISQNDNLLVFMNNGGSNIEEMCYAYIPCSVTYGFGKIETYVKVPVYPAH